VDAGRAYYGGDAYKQLAESKLDAVVIETPPYFHPEHARAAIEAGKHVYLAKPVAVDVPGCRSIQESAAKANGKLSFLVDFQTRARPAFQEAAERVHRGDIGKVAFAQVYYYAGRPSPDKSQPGMDPGEARVKNFYMDRVLGGDIIVEQNIHVIDVGNWMLNGHPIKAVGTGGRTNWAGTPYNAGDAYDHFSVTYWYPNDVHVTFSSNQITRAFTDLCVRCFGIDGCADLHYNGSLSIAGKNPWKGPEKDPTFKEGAVSNVKAFVESIRQGKYLNNTETAVESNMTAILGRTAAYKEQMVTWDEMSKSTEKFEAELKLSW
jgi:predicted dehydrogenase